MAKRKRKVAVIDFETDPFLYGRVPAPFCVEFWDGENSAVFIGDDCASQLADYLDGLNEECLIYAHNGGKFDFHFLHKWISDPCLIIKNRIVEATFGKHKIRDSFAILPVPLKVYDKTEIDYTKMERHCRHLHMDEILSYLHDDCVALFDLVAAFVSRFGPRMTIGGTAMKELKKLHDFPNLGSGHDAAFRPYYYGGRVQCFKSGKLPGPWKLFDVNSMYPSVMRNKKHPIGGNFDILRSMPDNFDEPFFITFEGINRNAIPSKLENGGLGFSVETGIFHACSHELEIALKYNLVDIHKVHVCYLALDSIKFSDFVDKFYAEKAQCKSSGDKIGELFAKLLLNSAYGRTGINPANFEEYLINRDFGNDEELQDEGFSLQVEYEDFELWSRPAEIREDQFCDVSIAASITSAARATLLEGLQNSVEPIYCDTDSIICRDFTGDRDKFRLGAWDLEKECEKVAIAGKKLYALYNGENELIKLSSKGGTLTLEEIKTISAGGRVRYENMAPTFSLKGNTRFIHREFKKTVEPAFERE